jgi:hypothetical protein
MRLTLEKLEDAFLDIDKETIGIFTFLSINHHLKEGDSIDLREALEFFRNDFHEVSVFVEKILRSSDIADVEYVIEILVEEDAVNRIWDRNCLRLLQAWRAKTIMQIVIDRGSSVAICAN